MARIEDTLAQAEIEDSLLGDVQEPAEPSPEAQGYFGNADALDLINSAIEEEQNNRFVLGDDGWHPPNESEEQEQRNVNHEAVREDWRSRLLSQEEAAGLTRQPTSEQAEAQAAPTAQQVQEGVASLDSFIAEHQLNDSVAAKEFSFGMVEAFGGELASYNVEQLGSTMAKVALSATNIYDTLGARPDAQLPPVSPESAKQFAHDFILACGGDPRQQPVNAELLANTAFLGAINFIDTARKNPSVTDVSRINSPEMSEWLLTNFLKAFGVEQTPDRAMALKFADTCGKYFQNFLAKYGQIEQKAQAPQRTSRGFSQRRGTKAERIAVGKQKTSGYRFKTNKDLEDGANYYREQHGRL